jgi:hypothetical protein
MRDAILEVTRGAGAPVTIRLSADFATVRERDGLVGDVNVAG